MANLNRRLAGNSEQETGCWRFWLANLLSAIGYENIWEHSVNWGDSVNICSVRDPAAQLEGGPVATKAIPTCRQIVLKLGPDTRILVKSSNVVTITLKQVQGAEKRPIHAKRHLETQLGWRYKKRYGNKVKHNWTHFNTCTPDIHTTTLIYTVTHSSEGYTSWSTILPTSHELLKHGEDLCSQMTETMAFFVEMIRFNNIKISTFDDSWKKMFLGFVCT